MFCPCYESKSARGCDGGIDGCDGGIDGCDGGIDGCDGGIDGCDGGIDGCDGGIDGEDDWPVVSGVVERTERWGVGDEVLDVFHGCYLLCSKVEGNVFARQVNKGTSMLSEIFDEYSYESAGAKKAADAGDVYQYWPILNFLCFGFMGDTAFVIAPLP
jgi:hypothetical protein